MPRGIKPALAAILLIGLSACSAPPQAVKRAVTTATPLPTLSPLPLQTAEPSPTVPPSPTAPSAPSPRPYPRLPIPTGTPRCHTSQLEVAQLSVGAATGNVLNSFEMRNRSSAACWVYGYVGFELLDAQGRALPQSLSRSTDSFFGQSDSPSRILLSSGTPPLHTRATGHAFFDVASEDVTCNVDQMKAVASLEIWPPDEYAAIVIPAHGGDWNGGFISCGDLTVNPLQIRPKG